MNSIIHANILKANSLYKINRCWNSNINRYSEICDWKTELNLAKGLIKNVVYADNCFVAISKPWGLPVSHSRISESNISRRKQDLLQSLDVGKTFIRSPIVLSDTFEYLANYFKVPKLYLARSSLASWSGITLLSSSELGAQHALKAIRRAKASSIPHLRFFCIVSGIIKPESGEERCGIELIDLDELAEYKEPVYVPPNKIKGDKIWQMKHPNLSKNFKVANVRWKTLAKNEQLGVSLVELETSVTRWSFVQCFLAYKASYILGDQYFSKKITHICGVPFVRHPNRKAQTVEQIIASSRVKVEISQELKKALRINYHSQLPLMVHLAGMNLPLLKRAIKSLKCPPITPFPETAIVDQNDSNDIVLDASAQRFLPPHFYYTLKDLGLNIYQ